MEPNATLGILQVGLAAISDECHDGLGGSGSGVKLYSLAPALPKAQIGADLRATQVERASEVVQQLEQRIWLTWFKVAIDRVNAYGLAEWAPEYAQVLVDRVTESRRSHPLTGVPLNVMTPPQRYQIYAARAASMASYTCYHFERQWVASTAYIQTPLLVTQRTPMLAIPKHARGLGNTDNLKTKRRAKPAKSHTPPYSKPEGAKKKRRIKHPKKLKVFSRGRGLAELAVGLKPR